MKFEGIFIVLLIVASLISATAAVPLSHINYKPIFDLSPGAWSWNSYPSFKDTGSDHTLYNADLSSSITPGQGTDLGQISGITYSPVFDLSPGAWSWNTYPEFVH